MALIDGRIALRSFHETKAKLFLIRCTMQVCTTVCGNTEVIASGKPLRPSTTASAGFQLIDHLEPEFGAFGLFDPKPKHALLAVGIERERHIHGLVLDQAFVADFDAQSVKKHHRIDPIERSVLPFTDLIKHRIRDPADQVRRDLGAIKFSQMALDLPHRHATCVKAQDLVVKAIEPGLMLANELRLKAAGTVARHRNLDLAVFAQYRLRTGAIAAVA